MHMSTNFPAISTVTGFYPGWCHNCCERAFCLSQTKNLLKCFHPALSCPLHPCMPFNYLSGFLSSIKPCPFVSSLQQVLVLPEICPSLLVISWCLWGLHFGRSSTLCRDFLTCCTVCLSLSRVGSGGVQRKEQVLLVPDSPSDILFSRNITNSDI